MKKLMKVYIRELIKTIQCIIALPIGIFLVIFYTIQCIIALPIGIFLVIFYVLYVYFGPVNFNQLGYLGVISFIPPIYLEITFIYLIMKNMATRKYKMLWVPRIWMIITLSLYAYYRFFSSVNFSCSNSYMHIVFLSTIYGLICSSSCFMGLSINETIGIGERSSILSSIFVLVSVTVIFFIFLLERLYSGPNILFDRFKICFCLLILAVSFIYILFGYFSKINNTVDPLLFLIFNFISFSLGFTFSVFIFEFLREMGGGISNHWLLVCVWSAFFGYLCLIMSNHSNWEFKAVKKVTDICSNKDEQFIDTIR